MKGRGGPFRMGRIRWEAVIYSFSHRTDGPAFYWPWFLDRLDEGFAQVRNPYYPDKVSTYDLHGPECEGFMFTSKDYRPVLDGRGRRSALNRLLDKHATMWSFTINPYRSDVERHVPTNAEAAACAAELSRFVGRERLTWMYSPIAMWDGVYDWSYHVTAFTWLAEHLADHVSRVSVDELRVYEKVSRNAPFLREPHHWELEVMLPRFAEVCDRVGIDLHSCPAHHDWSRYGIDMSPCLSIERFGEANGLVPKGLKVPSGSGLHGTCPGGCASVRDLAPYDSCPAGCVYCYANGDVGGRKPQFDVSSTMLCDGVRPLDAVSHAKQKRYFA